MARAGPATASSPSRPLEHQRRPPGTTVLVVAVSLLLAVTLVVGVASAVTVVVGFEGFDDGAPLTTEYEDVGVVFPPQPGQSAGVTAVFCDSSSFVCPAAANGEFAAVPPLVDQRNREAVVAAFLEPQQAVRLSVRGMGNIDGIHVARLVARDDSGAIVDEATVDFDVRDGWQQLTVTAASPEIEEVTLTLTERQAFNAGGEPHNRLVVDELQVQRPDTPPPPPADGDPWILLGIAGLGLLVGGWLLSRLVSRLRDGRPEDPANHPPVPMPDHSPPSPVASRPVVFDGTGSYDLDPEDDVSTYAWTVGTHESSRPRFVHVFDEPGDYDVTLEVTDSRKLAGRRTDTITVEADEGTLALAALHPDAPGDDHENLAEEYLVFENAGTASLSLSGWTIHDAAEAEDRVKEGEHTFEFPDGFELDPGATVTIHTGAEPTGADDVAGTADDRHCYWGRDWAVWNNEADIVVVEDERGDPVLGNRYERTDAGEYAVEDLEPDALADWFAVADAASGGRLSVERPSLDDGLTSLVPSRIRALVAGFAFLRGPRRAIASWAVLTALGYVVGSSVLLSLSTLLLAVGLAWGVLRRLRD